MQCYEIQNICNDLYFKRITLLEFRNKLHKLIEDCDEATLDWIAEKLG